MALVVFAACLSGMGQGTLGSDILGFAHAVLGTGCAAYLGALWNVDDRASAELGERHAPAGDRGNRDRPKRREAQAAQDDLARQEDGGDRRMHRRGDGGGKAHSYEHAARRCIPGSKLR